MQPFRTLKTFLQGKALSHPLHPVLVHIPIGAWILSFIFDVIGFVSSEASLRASMVQSSYWCLVVGIIVVLPTMATGLAEFVDVPAHTTAQKIGWAHMGVNFLVTVIYLLQIMMRSAEGATARVVIINGISFLLLGVSGYLGG
ncbi:MAG: DUF2231 domain-containing protein, partial [Bdellovibrionota bacterium]